MKTYTGELKDGMPVEDKTGSRGFYKVHFHPPSIIKSVYHDNEWQLYEKPKPKKVWGSPSGEETFYCIQQSSMNGLFTAGEYEYPYDTERLNPTNPCYLDKRTAEQVAKAMNYIAEFEALSDVPMDGEAQLFIDVYSRVERAITILYKFENAICGYVSNSREKAEADLAAYPKIALACKIVKWAKHGVECEEL